MNSKKFLLIMFVFLMIIFAIGKDTSANAQTYKSDILIKELTLKISLIQTASEVYDANINETKAFNKNLYKDKSNQAYNHYTWLKNTYSDMDTKMKSSLENIFKSKDSWEYINAVINLNDDASVDEIVDTLNCDKYLNLSNDLKNDIEKFFIYFYDEHFKSYYKKQKYKFDRKANNLNQKLSDNEVDVIKFIETSSGIKLPKHYKSIMYYNLNPLVSQAFEHDNVMISTIGLNATPADIVSIHFYKYARPLFDTFASSKEYLKFFSTLNQDKNFKSAYNNFDKGSYSFNDWCLENLISGYSKYLEYLYFGSTYENASYAYDLDFYNYLKDTGFNPNKISLKDATINFYNSKLNS